MRPGTRLILLLFLAGAGLSGCVFSTSSPVPDVSREYQPLDSPENLLNNLTLSLENQELDKYLEVLAPEYRFVFLADQDAACGSGVWDAARDSLVTAAMFQDPDVLDISGRIRHGAAVPATEVNMEGTWRIRSSAVEFYIRVRNEAVFATLGDPHEFFFRPGDAASGEDPDRWFLVEWRDLSERGANTAAGPGPAAVAPIHWWRIKCDYASGNR